MTGKNVRNRSQFKFESLVRSRNSYVELNDISYRSIVGWSCLIRDTYTTYIPAYARLVEAFRCWNETSTVVSTMETSAIRVVKQHSIRRNDIVADIRLGLQTLKIAVKVGELAIKILF